MVICFYGWNMEKVILDIEYLNEVKDKVESLIGRKPVRVTSYCHKTLIKLSQKINKNVAIFTALSALFCHLLIYGIIATVSFLIISIIGVKVYLSIIENHSKKYFSESY